MSDLIPKEALAYIKNKKLQTGFSYKDVWHEEHATAFTVAKAMQLEVLSDLHTAVSDAIEHGQSFESFKKNIKPVLQQKGWWGKKEMTDPLTGTMVNAQLGSDRRLKTIYRVNMRQAFIQQRYQNIMQSDLHPYIMYRVGNSKKHRDEHMAWDGLVLPKDDPWWGRHMPMKEYGCKCTIQAVSEADMRRYKEEGVPVAPRDDGTGGGRIPAKTAAPPEEYHSFYNERKETLEQVPAGVHPSFNWDQRNVGRQQGAEMALENARQDYQAASGNIVPAMADRERTAELQSVSTPFFKKLKKESSEDFAKLSFYSKGEGTKVNHALYNANWEKGPYAALIRSLDSTIAKYPTLSAETWFFKGDNAAYWKDAVVGKPKPVRGFLSTSTNKTRAESYITENKKTQPFMVVIRAPRGSRGLYIGSNTAYDKSGLFKKNEYEYLFPRGMVFRVLKKDEFHIVLEAIVE